MTESEPHGHDHDREHEEAWRAVLMGEARGLETVRRLGFTGLAERMPAHEFSQLISRF